MSEPTIAAVEGGVAALLDDAVKALAPEAQKELEDLHQVVAAEADRLRQDLPALVQTGVQHISDLGAEILGRYHVVMNHIDARLTGAVARGTAAPAAPAPATPAAAPIPEDAGPTVAPSAPTAEASQPSSTGSSSASPTPSTIPALDAAPAQPTPGV